MSGARETSGATTSLVAAYVRERAGEAGLARVHRAAGIGVPVEALMDETRWFTYEEKIALFEAAAVELDDPEVTRHMGEAALTLRVGAGLRVLLRTLGSPRVVLSNIARANSKFSTVSTFELVDTGRSHAVISYELRADKVPHRLDCLFNQGLVSLIGPLFGLPPLDVEHDECQALGAPRCVYRVSWQRRRSLRRHRERHLDEQIDALSVQLVALQTTAADLVSADDIAEVLSRIVARAGVAVRAPQYLLAVRDEAGELFVRADGFDSADEERRAAEEVLTRTDLGDRVLVRPVASARRHYGVLAAFYEASSFFDYEGDIFEAYARNAAAALDVVESLAEARRRTTETEALFDLATALAELSTPDDVAVHVAQAMRSLLAADSTVVFLLEDDRVAVRGVTGVPDRTRADLVGVELSAGAGHAELQRWLADPQPKLLEAGRAGAVGQMMLSAIGACSLLIVPIRRRGKVLGATGAGFVGSTPALADLQGRALAVADHAAIAIDNAYLLATMTFRALYDDLTGAATPSHFQDETERALARAARSGADLSVVFLDLDRFKDVNDRFGHRVGDSLLRESAVRIRRQLRGGDLLGRVGGDEFAITLIDTSSAKALVIAERIRQAVSEPVPSLPSVRIAASIGVATATGGTGTYAELLHRADIAMYEAKHAGRDTCVVSEAV